MDRTLDGRIGVIEGIDQDDAGALHVAVTLEEDPERDLGELRHPAHLFFGDDELELVGEEPRALSRRRVLVAGIGNIFFGDDGFGVAVAQRLRKADLPAGVEVVSFGIRGLDLAYALQRPYDAVIMVDAVPFNAPPGSLVVLEPHEGDLVGGSLRLRGVDPITVLGLARRLGALPPRVLIVGCQPGDASVHEPSALSMTLTPKVAAAVATAEEQVLTLCKELLAQPHTDTGGEPARRSPQ